MIFERFGLARFVCNRKSHLGAFWNKQTLFLQNIKKQVFINNVRKYVLGTRITKRKIGLSFGVK